MLKALHWIPIKKRTQYKMMLLVFNALQKQSPSYISDYLHWYTPSRPLRSMCSPSLTPARSRSVVIQRRILNGGCSQLWNSLPPGFRSTNSFISFKRQLKTYIFNLPWTLWKMSNNLLIHSTCMPYVFYVCIYIYICIFII